MLSDAQWGELALLIEECRPKGKTPPQELRCTISAILWRHQNGAKWRAIPEDVVAAAAEPDAAGNPEMARLFRAHGREQRVRMLELQRCEVTIGRIVTFARETPKEVCGRRALGVAHLANVRNRPEDRCRPFAASDIEASP